ncbi:MAG: 50S ribosomal protein L11 methyltransferase [Thermodesulfobacteriota bacterium]
MINQWVEIFASGSIETKDEAIEAFIEAGSPGVLECLSEDKTEKQTKGGKDKHGLKAYLPAEKRPITERKVKKLEERLKPLKWTISISEYKEENWTKKWKDAIHPVEVTGTEDGRRLIVRASWHKIQSRPDDIIIVIDPGMAFGTGSHPSTRMCLRALFYITSTESGNGGYGPIRSTLDVGSGTGILSIAAKMLNVGRVLGLDIEKDSVKIAKENARLNKVRCTFKEVSLAEPLKDIKGTFDLVVANIISHELIRIAGEMAGRVSPEGFIVLSGILTSEAQKISKVFTRLGFTPYMRYAESAIGQGGGDWVALVFRNTL